MRKSRAAALIRIGATGLGGVLVGLALFGRLLGVEDVEGFGTTQLATVVLGTALLTAGAAGRRLPGVYKGAALVLLNTLVLLAGAELTAAVILARSRPQDPADPRPAEVSSYYRTQEWSRAYWKEFDLADRALYHPYQLWRKAPFQGELIRVGVNGLRETPGVECHAGAYVVAAFGGSTVWGFGVPDWGTIPAYLFAALRKTLNQPVCVLNFGQLGWNSTQDLIALLEELQAGRVPDLVVFLSGVNDVVPAFQYGEAGVHYDLREIEAKLESGLHDGPPGSPHASWVKRTNLFRLARRIVSPARPEGDAVRFRYAGGEHVSDTLAASVVRHWIGTYRIVEALGREYGFEYGVFWQPNVLVGRKPLTQEEERFRLGEPASPLVELVYARVASITASEDGPDRLHNLTDVFAGDTALRYLDWHHLTPEGNRIIAEAIVQRLITGRRPAIRRSSEGARTSSTPGTTAARAPVPASGRR